jgi:predicted phage gp36 major capsid-like protein
MATASVVVDPRGLTAQGRRALRLQQVREQERAFAAQLRQRFAAAEAQERHQLLGRLEVREARKRECVCVCAKVVACLSVSLCACICVCE